MKSLKKSIGGKNVMEKKLSKKEVEYLIEGALILGTGGGGDPEEGRELLLNDLKEGRTISIIDPEELEEEDLTICAYAAGSIAPSEEEETEFPKIKENPVVKAVTVLEEYFDNPARAILPVEIGAGNTANALHIASKKGIPAIDGDLDGRSLPEIVHSTYNFMGIPITPLSIVDVFGNSLIVNNIVNDGYVDEIARPLSEKAGMVGVADHPVKADTMRKCVVSNSVSKAIKIGKSLLNARDKGEDPIKAVLEASNGYLLFRGTVKSKDWEDRGGYMYGETLIQGEDGFAGNELKIWFKNENLMAWKDGKAIAMAPDLISVLNAETGRGITNTSLKKGQEVVVLGMKGPEIWRTEKARKFLSPQYFGFDEEWIPIEKLHGERE